VFDAKRKGNNTKPIVVEANISQVVKMSLAFKDYMKGTHQGFEEEDLAYRYGNRNDFQFTDSGSAT
jgi:hypothetical protein